MGLPTILIVHGAWHTAAHYEFFVHSLRSRNYETLCPTLSSCKGAIPPTHALSEDVEQIRNMVCRLVEEEGKDVVVISHSYGGIVSTDAVSGFGKAERAKAGKAGGVIRLVYMAAFIPQRGQGVAGMFGGQLPPFIQATDDGLIRVPDPVPYFYPDIPSDEASYWVSQLVVHPTSAQVDPISREAWREIPVTYLKCEGDTALLPDTQQMIIDTIVKIGVPVHVEKCSGSHSPFLSMPQTVADIVSKIASSAV